MKATDTAKWRVSDIKDVQDALPESAKFGTLSASHKSKLKIDLGMGIPVDEIEGRVEEVKEALEEAGTPPIESATLTAGYNGSKSPHVLLVAKMEGDD